MLWSIRIFRTVITDAPKASRMRDLVMEEPALEKMVRAVFDNTVAFLTTPGHQRERAVSCRRMSTWTTTRGICRRVSPVPEGLGLAYRPVRWKIPSRAYGSSFYKRPREGIFLLTMVHPLTAVARVGFEPPPPSQSTEAAKVEKTGRSRLSNSCCFLPHPAGVVRNALRQFRPAAGEATTFAVPRRVIATARA